MYTSIKDLPASIRDALPEAAQELYRAAYNRVWEKLAAGEASDRAAISVQAHNAARLAVAEEFHQDAHGRWHHEPVGEEMKRRGNVVDPAVVQEPNETPPED